MAYPEDIKKEKGSVELMNHLIRQTWFNSKGEWSLSIHS